MVGALMGLHSLQTTSHCGAPLLQSRPLHRGCAPSGGGSAGSRAAAEALEGAAPPGDTDPKPCLREELWGGFMMTIVRTLTGNPLTPADMSSCACHGSAWNYDKHAAVKKALTCRSLAVHPTELQAATRALLAAGPCAEPPAPRRSGRGPPALADALDSQPAAGPD